MVGQYGLNLPLPGFGYQAPAASYGVAPMQATMPMMPSTIPGRNNYMIQVDGEMAAKA